MCTPSLAQHPLCTDGVFHFRTRIVQNLGPKPDFHFDRRQTGAIDRRVQSRRMHVATRLFSAGVAELVDALGLGPSAERLGGSSPFTRTRSIFFMVEPTEYASFF